MKLSGKLVFGLFFAKSSRGVQISVFPVNFPVNFQKVSGKLSGKLSGGVWEAFPRFVFKPWERRWRSGGQE